jgi:uncharacterized protein (TIGR02246 family)
MKGLSFASLVVAGLLASACTQAPPPVDMTAMQAEASRLGEDYMKAFAARDAAAIGNLFTEDAVELPGDTVSLVGRAAIVAAAQAEFAQQQGGPASTLIIEGKPVSATADLLVSDGTFSVSIPMPAGDPYAMRGKWMSLSVKEADGMWRMKRLIHNLNSAARPPMPPAPAPAGK